MRWGVGSLLRVDVVEVLAVVAFLLCEVFRGDTLRGDVGFVSV